MSRGVLITHGGPHSVSDWAEATARCVVDIGDHVAGTRRDSALRLQATIVDILERAHCAVQGGERVKLQEFGHDRLLHDLDASHHTDTDAVAREIIAAAATTAWADDFQKPETLSHLIAILDSHLNTSVYIERSWHADRNHATPQAVKFRSLYHSGQRRQGA